MRNLKKLLAVIVTIAMLATFAIPAFAADTVSADTAAASSIGMLVGDGNGVTTAYEATTPTRIQAAVLMLRLKGLEAEAKAYTGTDNFADAAKADWAKPIMAYLKANPALGFVGDGVNFDPAAKITAQQYYKVVLTALGYVQGTDFEFANTVAFAKEKGLAGAADVANFTIGSLATATIEGLKANVKGGASLASALVAAGKLDAAKAEAAGVYSSAASVAVTATGAKLLTLTFNKAVDTTKAVITVKRETIKVNSAAITWNDAKTVATVEMASKLTKATYNVAVSGVADKDVTGSVTVVDEKVAKIEIPSNQAPLTDLTTDSDANIDDLSVAYRVYNQYGEDITKTTTVVATSSGSATTVYANKKIVEIEGNFDAYVSNKAAVTIINADTGVSATASLNVVSQAKVGEITIVGLYNKDGKTLTETTNLGTDKFYVEITAKDQYGNEIDPATHASEILVSESNATIVNLDDASGVPNVLDTVVDDRYFVQLLGVTGTGTNFAKAGDDIVNFISRSTGKSNSLTVTVGVGTRASSITLGQPDLVAVGEDAFLPLTVLDASGAEIKDITLLGDATRGVTVTATGSSIVLKDGAVYVKVAGAQNTPADAIKTVTVATNSYTNYKSTYATYTVKAAAVPKTITGFRATSKISSSLNGAVTQTIKPEDFTVEDQYGRVMSKTDFNTWMDLGTTSITLESTTQSGTDLTAFAVSTTAGATDAATIASAASTTNFVITPNTTTGAASSEKLTFTLVDTSLTTSLAASAKAISFNKAAMTDFASFKVDAPTAVYNANAENFDLKVYGVTGSGTEVLLANTNYSLALPGGASPVFSSSYSNGVNTVSVANALASSVVDNDSATAVPVSKDQTITVTIGDDSATQIKQVVAVSAADKDAAELGFTKDGNHRSDAFDGSNFATIAAGTTVDAAALAQYLYMKDIYGDFTDNYTVAGAAKITFSNLKKSTGSTAAITVATNGSTTASVTNFAIGDQVTVTVAYKGVSKTITLTRAN
jgi:hypothetical protein